MTKKLTPIHLTIPPYIEKLLRQPEPTDAQKKTFLDEIAQLNGFANVEEETAKAELVALKDATKTVMVMRLRNQFDEQVQRTEKAEAELEKCRDALRTLLGWHVLAEPNGFRNRAEVIAAHVALGSESPNE